MKKRLMLQSFFALCAFLAWMPVRTSAQADGRNWGWVKHAGSKWYDYGLKINTDANGNVYAAVRYEDQLAIEGDTLNLLSGAYNQNLLVKYSRDGKKIWLKDIQSHKEVFTTALELDASENVYICGYFKDSLFIDGLKLQGSIYDYEGFVAKFSRAGSIQWLMKLGGGGDDKIVSAHLDASGNLIVAGNFFGYTRTWGSFTLNALETNTHMFILSVSPSAAINWAKNSKGGNPEMADMVLDKSGNIFVSGRYNSGVTINGSTYVTTGPVGTYDFYLFKFDKSGNFIWSRDAGTPSGDEGTNLATDPDGNCYMTGYFGIGGSYTLNFDSTHAISKTKYYSFYLVKYGSDGSVKWAFKYDAMDGSSNQQHVLKTDAAGNLYLSGRFDGIWMGDNLTDTIAFSGKKSNYNDICIQQFLPDGSRGWQIFAGNNMYGTFEDVMDLCFDRQGSIYITGGHGGYDSLRIGSVVIKNQDMQDYYLAQLSYAEKIHIPDFAPTKFCAGDDLVLPFSVIQNSFLAGNQFTLQLSGATGLFSPPVDVATLTGNSSDSFTAKLPPSLAEGSAYRFRVKATSPAYLSYDNGQNVFISALPVKPGITKTDSILTCTVLAAAYQWFIDDSLIAGANAKSWSAHKNGLYKVMIINAAGCENTSDTVRYTKKITVGIDEIMADNQIKMYPNPASAFLHVESRQEATLSCMNMMGEMVIDRVKVEYGKKDIDISSLAPGLYTLCLKTGNKILYKAFVVAR